MPKLLDVAILRSAVRHPAVWCLPVMALVACAAMPFNDGYYEYWINFDPQGDGQQQEWQRTRRIFRYTSGVLCGQSLALVVGVALSRRHRQAVALAVAVPVGALLAGVTVAVAFPMARSLETSRFAGSAVDDPVLMPVLLRELAAFPLYAAAGVGLGVLLTGRWRSRRGVPLRVPFFLLGWCAATMTGLLQDDEFDAWPWLLWAVPFVAAGTAIALAGLSLDVWEFPPVPVGDWGHGASVALLVSAAAYAVGLNLLAYLVRRRAARRAGAALAPGR